MKKKMIILAFALLFIGAGLLVYFGQQRRASGELFYSGTIETTQAKLSFQAPAGFCRFMFRKGRP